MIVRSIAVNMLRTRLSICLFICVLSVIHLHLVRADNGNCNNPFANRKLSLLNNSAISYLTTPSSAASDLIASCPVVSDSSCCNAHTEEDFRRLTDAFHSEITDVLRAIPAAVITGILARANVNISYETLTPLQSSLLHSIQQTISEVVLMPATATCVDMLTSQVAGSLCWSCSPTWQDDMENGAVRVNLELIYIAYRSCQTSLDALSARLPTLTEHFTRLVATAASTEASITFLQNAFIMRSLMNHADGFTFESLYESSLVSWFFDVAEGESLPFLFTKYAIRGLDYDFESWMRPSAESEWAPFRVSGSMGHQTGDLWHRLAPAADGHSHRRLLSVEATNKIGPIQHQMSIMHGAMEHEQQTAPKTENTPPPLSLLTLVRTATTKSQQTPSDSSSDAHANGRLPLKYETDVELNFLHLGCASALIHNKCPQEKLEILLPRTTFVPALVGALSLITLIALIFTVRHNMRPNAKTFRRMKRDGDKFITTDNTAPPDHNNTAQV